MNSLKPRERKRQATLSLRSAVTARTGNFPVWKGWTRVYKLPEVVDLVPVDGYFLPERILLELNERGL